MASAYIKFFQKYRKEHGGGHTVAENRRLASEAGKAWRAMKHGGGKKKSPSH